MKTTLRITTLALMMGMVMTSFAQTRDFIFNNSAADEGLSVEQDTRSGLQMRHALKALHIVSVSDNGYAGEVLEGGSGISLPANPGEPDLPSFSRFVAVPNGASAHIEMGYRSVTTIQNVDLLAAAPIKFDTDDTPNTYERDMSIYGKNAFFPEEPVSVSAPFNLRGVQTVAVTVVPYQYNPVTKELRVYDDMQFDVRFDGGNGEFGDSRLRSPYWDPILMQNLANYDQLPVVDYEARMQDWVTQRPQGCEYLIVIPNNESFRPYANQLAEYRIKQGILTEVKSLSDMGCTTTDQMKAYFHNAYNSWTIPPVAVLLLGDHNTNMALGIPAEYTYHSSSYGNCITDNGYADVDGDLLPDMAFCRLVAANANEAQMMVSKQLEYEYTNPNMNASTYDQPITALGWQTQRWFQICSEVVGGYWRNQGKHPVRINAIYSGTPGSQWSSNQNTYMVVNYFGPNGRGYIPATPNELGGWTGGTAAQVVDAVNSGCMLLQHRDHGYYQGWGEPSFSTSHVSQMNNVGKMTFVNTINCQTGTFDYSSDCLIETFMRRTYNNQNAGAVGCIGPTQTSYSFVNDTYAWGLYDQYDPQFLPDFGPYANYEGNWRPAFGNVAGKYFLQQSSWPYNPESKAITHKMFTAHCDAFLTLFTQVPTAMNVSHPAEITTSTTTINVSAPQGAVIALTRDNNILAVATATGSTQSVNFAAQPTGTITIVATKQDRLRYVGSINVISEPELVMTEVTLSDANGNGQLEYGEQARFNLTVKNTGDLASTAATATLSTVMQDLVSITDATTTIPALSPNQSITLDEVFGIRVADNVPDGTLIRFSLLMTDGTHTWNAGFNFTAYAPNFKIEEEMIIDDNISNRGHGNGRLDPGETAEISFIYQNIGGAEANNVVATLGTMIPYLSISNPSVSTATVSPAQTVTVTYTVSVAPDMPRGEDAVMNLQVVAGAYNTLQTFHHRVGLELANFENGMDDFEWENDPDHPWVVSSIEPYAGAYCLQSGTIGHNESSTLSLHFNVENPMDEIRFYRKTDCEANDHLKFCIDGQVQQTWSETLNWREMTFAVSQGEHTFSWIYEKDASGSSGADHVWIDEILFPVRHITFACDAGLNQETCVFGNFELEGTALGYETVEWTSDGDGVFSDANALVTTYEPGPQDRERKTVTLTLTVTNAAGETLSDSMVGILHDPASIEMDESADICEGETYELHATVNEAEDLYWEFVGDGQMGDEASPVTTYTPGPQDIENGFVTFYLNAFSSCGDDTAMFTLFIHRKHNVEFEVASCGSYTWNGIEYSEEGDYEQQFQSVYGCDSIVTMHLVLIESYNIETEMTACDAFEWNGTTYYESGVYENTFTSIHGCDSTVVMHLTVNTSNQVAFQVDACESYEWDGTVYTESGDFEQVYANAAGCDSIVTLHLSINRPPVVEAIVGDDAVDVLYFPSSEYSIEGEGFGAEYRWSIEPEGAGDIVAEGSHATVYWSDTFKGQATLKAEAENECGESGSTLSVAVKNSTDVDELGAKAKLYPNPTQGMVTIEAENMQRLTVSNVLGQVVDDVETGNDTYILNLKPFGAGMYTIRIRTAEGVAVKRVMVTQ